MTWYEPMVLVGLLQAAIFLATGVVIFVQLRHLKLANRATGLAKALDFLNDPAARDGRGVLLGGFDKPNLTNWTDPEKESIRKACNAFDLAGIIAANKIIPAEWIVREYRDRLVTCWEKAHPLIAWEREHHRFDYWDDFEMLYRRAKGT